MKNIMLFFLLGLGACSAKNDLVKPEFPIIGMDGNGYLKNEVRPAASKPCFQGAYYRKIVSSTDVWAGIKAEVTLPKIEFDPARINPNKPKQSLDNPSVYLGGNMGGQETDIGLTWEVIRDEKGNITEDRRAFRPFLRRSAHSSGQVPLYQNAPAEANYYWYPGEKITMTLEIAGPGKLKFSIQGAGKKYESIFESAGYTLGALGEFKRVNAIDQVANEGKPVQLTNTKVLESTWSYTSLFRYEAGQLSEVPMHSGRMTQMECPESKYFKIQQDPTTLKKGGETVSISGGGFTQ
ncbi:hypothetical protein ACR78Z_08085 [Sphingobacterium thalpophilum]